MNNRLRNKWIKKTLPISVMIAVTMIVGSAGPAFAAPPTHADKAEVLVSFTEKPGTTEQALTNNAGGKVKRNYHEAGSGITPGDMIPPTTIIELSGLEGNEGWYRSEVRVELSAVDSIDGSGVAETRYSLDGGQTWQSYHQPFAIASEGTNTIQARSRDNAGNLEVISASREVNIDKTGPSVNIFVDPSIIWPATHKQVMVKVWVTASARDVLSRVSSTEIVVKDEYGQVEPIIGPYLQGRIWLEAWRKGSDIDGRVYTISITATDYAGNITTAETTVTVPHDRGKEKVNNDETSQETLEATDGNRKQG